MDEKNCDPWKFKFSKLVWKRVKKLITEKNFNWNIDEKLIVVWNIGEKFKGWKMRKKIIIDEEVINRNIARKKKFKSKPRKKFENKKVDATRN